MYKFSVQICIKKVQIYARQKSYGFKNLMKLEGSQCFFKFLTFRLFFKNRPTYGDFEISLATPQLHQNLKPIRLLTCTKFLLLYIYLDSKLIHIKFLTILKDIFAPSSSSSSSRPVCEGSRSLL